MSIAMTLWDSEIQNTDAFIINTYYYPQSKSFGDNGLAMILLMDRNTMKEVTEYKMKLVASNETAALTSTPKLLKETFSNCEYISVVAKGNVLSGMTKLEIVSGETRMEIPFRRARSSSPSPVIICLSPQFVAEQWQLFVAHAHVARRFGGHLHLYVTSMIDSYFELVLEYEKHGYVTVDFWMRVHFANVSSTSPLEPNANSEWRNQAGAHTDCLLQYKEAATFITFFDLDDLLFPRGFDSYYEEFAALSFMYPSIRTFHYNKREFAMAKETTMSGMNFTRIFGHPNYNPRVDEGKVVARPINLDSMWIHRSFNVPSEQSLRLTSNFLTHLQKPVEAKNSLISLMNVTFVEDNNLKVNQTTLDSIQGDFERMINIREIREKSERLPIHSHYFGIIFQCYNDKYYNTTDEVRKNVCPNAEGCQIPQREDLKCVHSDSNYMSGPRMFPVKFHYHIDPSWSRTIGCQL